MALVYVYYGFMNPRELIAKSHDILRSLEEQTGYSIALGALIPDSGRGKILASIDGTAELSFHLEIGYEFELHIGASKALIAHLSELEREAIYPHMNFTRYTPTTICSIEEYERELESVREKNYAVDLSEYLEGCHCIGVPVFNEQHKVIAAIWATGPSNTLPLRQFDQLAEQLRLGAHSLTERLKTQGRSPNREQINGMANQLRQIIHQNLHRSIDMQEIADDLFVSYSWLRHAFKDLTGEAPTHYHLNRRIEKAKELLTETDFPVRRIAEELGFNDQNHFSSLFKRKAGCSPLNYRKANP